MSRPVFDRPCFQRPSFSRPVFTRPSLVTAARSGPTPITITSAVLTWDNWTTGRLVLELSAAPGDTSGPIFPDGTWSIRAASRTLWGYYDGVEISGTTLTIEFSGADFGSLVDSNYSSGNDLFNYSGDSTTPELAGISAVTNLPITFTGGALAVPSGTWTISGDFGSDAGQVDGSFSRACTDIETEDAGTFSGETGSHHMAFAVNPATIAITGSTFQAVFISNGSAHVDTAQFAYTGTSSAFVDSLGRPIPPFVKALSP